MWAPIACLHEADGRRRPQCVLWDVWVSDPGGASLEGEPQGAQGRASEEGRAREGGSTPLPSGNLAVAHLSRPMRPPPATPRAWACPPGQTPQAHQPKVRVVGAPGLSAGLRRGRRPLLSEVLTGGCLSEAAGLCLVRGFTYPDWGHCGIQHALPVLGSSDQWALEPPQVPASPTCLRPGSLPSARSQHFGQPLPRAFCVASRSLQGSLWVRDGGPQRAR